METPSIPRLLEQLTARRQVYRRSKTVASLPLDGNVVDAKQSVGESSDRQTPTKLDAEDLSLSSSALPINRTADTATDVKRSSQRQRSNSPRGSQKGQGQGQGPGQGQGQGPFQGQCGFGASAHQKAAKQQYPRKVLGRTPSSPSILLSKVREKIKEKVIETSVEWPNMAAIVQERRQKAASAFEAQLTRDRLRMTRRSDKKVLGQSKSSTGEVVVSRSWSRTSLRRRSLSIDAFDSLLQLLQGEKGNAVEVGGGGAAGGGGGVTCTDDDLKSIAEKLKQESSPLNMVDNRSTCSVVAVINDESVPVFGSSLLGLEQRGCRDAVTTNSECDDDESDQSMSHRCDESSRPNETDRSPGQPETRFRKTYSRSADKSSGSPIFLQSHTALCRSSSVNVGRERVATPLFTVTRRPSSVRRGVFTACHGPGLRASPNSNSTSPSKFLRRDLSNLGQDQIRENKRCLSLELKDRWTHNRGGCPELSGRRDSSSDSSLNLKCPINDLFDPVIIGQAIEIHLETMMRTKASSAESTVTI